MKTRSIARLATLALSATALSACVNIATTPKSKYFTSHGAAQTQMPPAPLPTYNAGDMYYYSNGWRETVVRAEGETVDLINSRKRKLVNFRSFFIPTPYLEGSTKEFFKESRVSTNALWPLAVGKSVRFSTEGRSVSKENGRESKYTQNWSCSVDGTERVRVLAGEFDTYVISCQRRSSRGKWWQTYTYYYAPELGTYVMRRSLHKKNGERVRELTALRPTLKNEPQNVRTSIIRNWQNALEYSQSGEAKRWSDPKTGTATSVTPLATYKAQNGQFCRTYKQHITRNAITRLYAGVACRTDKLKWRTPRRG